MSQVTIVIPTYNRAPVLRKALDGYRLQSAPELIHELIVVDDGSTDDTEAVVREMSEECAFSVRYVRQTNMGPAAARNRGIRKANTDLILFSDSDIVPLPDLVREHVEWHKENPEPAVAVLGYVTWFLKVTPTPFMKWYGECGPLFAFQQLQHGKEVSFLHFYSCNISLKTDFVKARGLFDEEFKAAAFEDIELGYRLSQSGLRLLYNQKAIAYHYQSFTFKDACRKAEANARWAHIFYQKEAGRRILAIQRPRQSRWSYRIAKWLASAAGNSLRPASSVVDSRVPLPSVVYHLFYWYYVTRRLEAVVEQ